MKSGRWYRRVECNYLGIRIDFAIDKVRSVDGSKLIDEKQFQVKSYKRF